MDFSRVRVEYGSDQDKGECVGGGWNRQQKTASSTCGKWEEVGCAEVVRRGGFLIADFEPSYLFRAL